MNFDLAPVLDYLGVDYDPDRERNQKVNCPFHDDNVASCSVNLEEGLLNCFGCGVSGDAISLLMHKEGIEFGEAKRLAEKLAGEARPAVSRGADTGGGWLPRRQGSRPGRRAWKSPWAGKRT